MTCGVEALPEAITRHVKLAGELSQPIMDAFGFLPESLCHKYLKVKIQRRLRSIYVTEMLLEARFYNHLTG